MKKRKIIKNIICLVLTLTFLVSVPGTGACAASAAVLETPGDGIFSWTVTPGKTVYQAGENIEIFISAENVSLDKAEHLRVWIDYPLTQYYLTPGATEHFERNVSGSYSKTMHISEDDGVMNVVTKLDGVAFVRNVLLKLIHFYKSLTLIYTTLRYRFENRFFGRNQVKEEIGRVTVRYEDTEIEITAYARYNVIRSKNKTVSVLSSQEGMASAEITASAGSFTGLAFGCNEDLSHCGLFVINPDMQKAYLYTFSGGEYRRAGQKSVKITDGGKYNMSVFSENGRVIAYLTDDDGEENPYPVFDVRTGAGSGSYGVFAPEGGYSGFTVKPYSLPSYEKTYTNPVYDNAPDPFILYDGGKYFLYATTGSTTGFRVSVSENLSDWRDAGTCARKGTIYGSDKFWAPEVYKCDGKYYLLYSTDEHIALAVSDSPYGPFEKTKDGYLFDFNCIDGHIFFDDDGSRYLYMAYWGETGEEVWGCRINRNFEPDEKTLTKLTYCRDDEGGVNEGPFMLKHDGRYYLTYSVNGYTDKNYNVRLAASASPLGEFVPQGTVLEWAEPLVGTGHHSFMYSPDGTELFIIYHCHYSVSRVHNRRLCIDRCRFVKTDGGYTLKVYGPTSTPQPLPSQG